MKISVVTTLYHSEGFVDEFYSRVLKAVKEITETYEIIFVNDGSPDNALEKVLVLRETDHNVVVIDLARNFGHHQAIMTGLQHADGDYVFLIDSDLEERPELLEDYWKAIREDEEADVVYGVQIKRKGGLSEVVFGKIWYSIFKLLADIDYPADSLTARLMTRRYVDNVLRFTEKELEIWGVFVLTGFRQIKLPTTKGNKGSTTYSYSKKIKMVVNSITSFSSKPLIAAFLLGITMSAIAAIFVVYFFIQWFVHDEIPAGWSSTLISIWLVGGILMFFMGIIGIYLSKMFQEIKGRPLTIIRKIYK